MTDESNGESTFEFVEKRVDEISISGDTAKTDSISSLSSSASLLTPLGGSSSTGNLLSNVQPPSALPSFLSTAAAQPHGSNVSKDNLSHESKGVPVVEEASHHGVQTKQPQPQSSSPSTSAEASKNLVSIAQAEVESKDLGMMGGALFSWVKDTVVNNSMLNKVAEKAKSSVNSMITTLDPQMREFIYSGGDVEIVVASNKEVKVSPIREAFQGVFGKATVTGVAIDTSGIAGEPVGFDSGIAAAEQRIKYARDALGIPREVPIVAVQTFLLEVGTNKWYELAVILLDDQKNAVNLQMFTQMTPVPSQVVLTAQKSTPDDYPLKSLGLSLPIGSLMATNLQVSFNEWYHALTGVSRRDTILLAAQSLAGIYKNTITAV